MAGTSEFKRVLLKVSGEVLMGDGEFGLDPKMVSRIANDIAEVQKTGIELCLVVGGGNIFRGVSVAAQGMERASADYMGMLATVMNALALQSALEECDVPPAYSRPFRWRLCANPISAVVPSGIWNVAGW